MGGRGATKGFLIIRVSIAAASVIAAPSSISSIPNGEVILASRHPRARPAIASGKRRGSIVSASDMRN